MAEASNILRTGTICEIRRGSGHWRIIDERFDGHVTQYLLQSLRNGEIAWRFRHEITEKNSSTYQDINDFLQTIANDFDDDIFQMNFDNYGDQTLDSGLDNNFQEVSSAVPQRFKQVSQSNLDALKESNTEATTNKQTKWAVKMLKDYMMEAGFGHSEFEMMPVAELDALLEQFYAALLSKTGKEYSKPTHVAIRAGLNRHITALPFSRKLSLMRDRDFVESNKILSGKIKTLKREGKDLSQNKEPISDKDLEKLYISGVFSLETPVSLQKKVMFEIIAQFGRRGREGLQNLRKDSFVIAVDADGDKYVKMSYNEADKTHHGVDTKENVKQPRMYEQKGNKCCPVLSFEKYMSKLNPNCERFFQRPLCRYDNCSVWYANSPVGMNTVNNLMSNLSKEACLSVRYTNHCIRAMVSSNLHKAGFSSSSIMAVTGHRNVQSLTHYIKPSDQERKKLSSHLSYGNLNISETATSSHLVNLAPCIPTCENNQNNISDIQVAVNSNGNMSKSVDVSHSGNMTHFQLFPGNISSSTIHVYCNGNPFDK